MIIILLQFGILKQEKSAEKRKMPFLATESIHMPFPTFASSFSETNILTFNVFHLIITPESIAMHNFDDAVKVSHECELLSMFRTTLMYLAPECNVQLDIMVNNRKLQL